MESIKELRKICQNKGYQEHVSYRPYRMLSIYLTKLCLILKIGSVSVTLLGLSLAIIGGYLYLTGHFISGSILFLIFMVSDFVDGEIARYNSKLSSELGAWLDPLATDIISPIFFLTLGFGIYFQTGIFWHAVLGAVNAIVKNTEKLVERSMSQETMKDIKPIFHKRQNVFVIKAWLRYIGKLTVIFPLIIPIFLLGWEEWFLWFYAIYISLFTLSKIIIIAWQKFVISENKKNIFIIPRDL